jgi:2-amino-4-hydroxy-6-hydroxymethyldihydropteridine diphosphokinase
MASSETGKANGFAVGKAAGKAADRAKGFAVGKAAGRAEGKAGALVVLGIGSNKGERRKFLTGAIAALGEALEGIRRASFIESEALPAGDQGRFLNTALAAYCRLSPYGLLDKIHAIEASFGRDRSREGRWGERTLDIDILLFGDRVLSDYPVLEIPHPRLRERRFALEPLLELLPEARDPLTGVPYKTILAGLLPQGIYYPEDSGYNGV